MPLLMMPAVTPIRAARPGSAAGRQADAITGAGLADPTPNQGKAGKGSGKIPPGRTQA